MNEGWIRLHRKLTDNPLWKCEKFTRGQAWVDLLLLANHKYGYFYLRNHKIEVQSGQVGYSQLKLAERWKWSRSKVKKFLEDLEKEQQVVQQITRTTTIITIINYKTYQQKEQQGVQQKSNRAYTNKNDKNDKKEYTPKQFYKLEKENAEGKYRDKYVQFVDYLFGENEMNDEITPALNLNKQVSYKQFNILLNKVNDINNEIGSQKISILNMLKSMYNKPKSVKDNICLYSTLDSWTNMDKRRLLK